MPPPLVTAVNRELTEQRGGDWIGPVALLRLRQPGPLDLGRARGQTPSPTIRPSASSAKTVTREAPLT